MITRVAQTPPTETINSTDWQSGEAVTLDQINALDRNVKAALSNKYGTVDYLQSGITVENGGTVIFDTDGYLSITTPENVLINDGILSTGAELNFNKGLGFVEIDITNRTIVDIGGVSGIELTNDEYNVFSLRIVGTIFQDLAIFFPGVAGFSKIITNNTLGGFKLVASTTTAFGSGSQIPPNCSSLVYSYENSLFPGAVDCFVGSDISTYTVKSIQHNDFYKQINNTSNNKIFEINSADGYSYGPVIKAGIDNSALSVFFPNGKIGDYFEIDFSINYYYTSGDGNQPRFALGVGSGAYSIINGVRTYAKIESMIETSTAPTESRQFWSYKKIFEANSEGPYEFFLTYFLPDNTSLSLYAPCTIIGTQYTKTIA